MRTLMVGLVVAVTAAFVPTWAMAANQEVAEQIAANLRTSGQLHNYKIGVKVQDGTAWLRGRVPSQQQLNAALKVVFETEGVKRVVNKLEVGSTAQASGQKPVAQFGPAIAPEKLSRQGTPAQVAPRPASMLKRLQTVGHAERVASSFSNNTVRQVAATAPQKMVSSPKPMPQHAAAAQRGRPLPVGYTQGGAPAQMAQGQPVPAYSGRGGGPMPVRYDQPHLPSYSWPGYASYPNYAALTYPKQYSPTAWPYIGPFYPYPQVPLGWREVTLKWHDGWWMLDFKD